MQEKQQSPIHGVNASCSKTVSGDSSDTIDSVLRSVERLPLWEFRRTIGGRIARLFSWYRY